MKTTRKSSGRATEFGARLRQLRTRLGLTQLEFANRYCINVRTLEKWELGTRKPGGAVKSFIIVIDEYPHEVAEALQRAALEKAEELPYDPSRE